MFQLALNCRYERGMRLPRSQRRFLFNLRVQTISISHRIYSVSVSYGRAVRAKYDTFGVDGHEIS